MRQVLLLALMPACTGGPTPGEKAGTGDCPVAVVTPTALDWPDLRLGEPATADVALSNACDGAASLTVTAAVSGSPAFTASDAPVVLAPGAVATLSVTVTSSSYGVVTGMLSLTTDDPDLPSLELPLSATVDADGDNDGVDAIAAGGTDCDDTDATVYPGAVEGFDGLDGDCNGRIDDVVLSVTGLPTIEGDAANASATLEGFGDTDGDGALEVGVYQAVQRGTPDGLLLLDGADYAAWSGAASEHGVALLDVGTGDGFHTSRRWSDHTGDGLADVPMSYVSGERGPEHWFLFDDPNGTRTAADARITCTGPTRADAVGYLSSADDLDGDGVAEVIYAPARSSRFLGEGGYVAVFDVAGVSGAITLDDAILTVQPNVALHTLGTYRAVGDVDGDGYGDLGIGGEYAVYTYLILGDGLSTTANDTVANLVDVTVPGPLVAIEDYDGDGVDDVTTMDGRVYTDLAGRYGEVPVASATSHFVPTAAMNCMPSTLVSDIDADGVTDLNVQCQWWTGTAHDLTLFFGVDALAAGTIHESAAMASADWSDMAVYAYSRDLVDLDGDGDDELLMYDWGQEYRGYTYVQSW